jgi:hypothetical protein
MENRLGNGAAELFYRKNWILGQVQLWRGEIGEVIVREVTGLTGGHCVILD